MNRAHATGRQGLAAMLAMLAAPLAAQDRGGQTATTSAGQMGQRQTRDQVAQDAGIEPMARIDSRIQSRVQSRLRNRIDLTYDPLADATSSYLDAGRQARVAGRPRRR